MKKFLISSAIIALLSGTASAQVDVIGGPDGSTQTVHHCGFLPMSAKLYTSSAATIRIIEHKLIGLGYSHITADGVYGKKDKLAVKRFQKDYGLAADGVVGPMTAQKLAFVSHPSENVHRCYRMASN